MHYASNIKLASDVLASGFKSSFSDHLELWGALQRVLDACQREGPQVVSRRGTEAAVLAPIEQWHRLQAAARPSLKQLLLASDALGARNVGDFSHFEVPLLNPFTSRADLSR